MATALLQFTQGANTDVAGKAVLGEAGEPVTVTNGNNAGVASWKIYLLDAPSDSTTFPPASQPQILAQAGDDSPTVDFTPDVAGSYRLMLEVTDGGGVVDRDIRCFGVPDAFGFVKPPYQQHPEPLPSALPGIISVDPRPVKPDEQNYGDNLRGWAGTDSTGQLDDFFKRYADLPFRGVQVTPFTATEADPPLHLVDVVAAGGPVTFNLPLAPRVGFVSRIGVLGPPGDAVTVQAQGGGNVGSTASIELVGNMGAILVHHGGNEWAVLARSASAGGSVAPLSNTLYVDVGTAAVTQDGSIGAPFATLTAAIAAAAAGGILLVAPGDYSGEGALTIDKVLTIAPTPPTLIGTAGLNAFFPGIVTVDSFEIAAGMTLLLFGTGANAIELGDAVAGVALDSCSVGTITGPGSVNGWNSNIPLPLSVSTLSAYNCQLLGTPATITLSGVICDLAYCAFDTSSATSFTFSGSPGEVRVDSYTNYWLGLLESGAGLTISNGTKTVIGALGVPDAESSTAWDAAAPEVLTILTAGQHPAGVYVITGTAVVTTAAATGTVERTLAWTAPTFGAASHVSSAADVATTGPKLLDPVVIVSDGTADVTATFTGTGITGSPEIDLYGSSANQGLI